MRWKVKSKLLKWHIEFNWQGQISYVVIAYKPRTSPYSFQGLKADGLELLKIASRETGLPIVTTSFIATVYDNVFCGQQKNNHTKRPD
ncbi:hypothetical protein [Ethanoligenens harbinense]|uniref:hypothetical protein n=1 Tax=Ethanoligenens harbinense TaxID=253239 RepID=UPI003100C44A